MLRGCGIKSRYLGTARVRSIGIRAEEKSPWEARAPLTPRAVKDLRSKYSLEFVVEPSRIRAYPDHEYIKAGASINSTLDKCDLILGIKEIPIDRIIPDRTYMCFSHCHKGQQHNMPRLQTFVNKGCTLIDYELLFENGKRLVAFGQFAGYAGMVNCLHSVGRQLLQKGYRTPFLNVALAQTYPSLEACKAILRTVGEEISSFGVHQDLPPLLFVFTGDGNGAREMFDLLPHKYVDSRHISKLQKKPDILYGCVLRPKDYTQHIAGHPVGTSYFSHPEQFESSFGNTIAPFATALINGIYWEPRYPRILSKQDIRQLRGGNLVSIADISCDINGSIELTSRATSIDEPFIQLGTEFPEIMAIDNLPAQFPRESSEHFASQLNSIIGSLAEGRDSNIIQRATIVEKGQLTQPYQGLCSVMTAAKTKQVLLLGSGFVAGPVVKYLSECGHEVIIASNSTSEASALAQKYKGSIAISLDIAKDQDRLLKLCRNADIVVSLLPAAMHVPIAEVCLAAGRHLVTASYISEGMAKLHDEAAEKGLLFLNELGLDPGLDHLSAKQIIDRVHSAGEEIIGFESWCGGLPAPECADNPLGYKFSWSPRGVLLAALNPAQFLENGTKKTIDGSNLLNSVVSSPVQSRLALEGLYNRDSLKYIHAYGLDKRCLRTMTRGTLRYQGFAHILSSLAGLGYLSTEPLSPPLKAVTSWEGVFEKLKLDKNISLDRQVRSTMQWLGLNSVEEGFDGNSTSLLDAFCVLLQKKLRYEPTERDMIFMQHKFTLRNPKSGQQRILRSTLLEFGHEDGFSAMARTVGYPVAVATQLLLEGKIGLRGVLAPLDKCIYEPMLERLNAIAKISFKEQEDCVNSEI